MNNGPRPTVPVVVTIIWGILVVPGLLGAALTPMFFDAPGSMSNPGAWLSVAIVLSFPCLCIISIAASWLVWRWHRRAVTRLSSFAQIAAACLPLIPVGFIVAVLVIGWIGLLISGQPMGLHSTVIKP